MNPIIDSFNFDSSILILEVRCSSDELVGVQLPTNCTLTVGESCDNFTCKAGYEKNQAITSLNCTESGTWNQNVSSLCIGLYYFLKQIDQ